jgi:hypothetical protein
MQHGKDQHVTVDLHIKNGAGVGCTLGTDTLLN